MTAVRRIALACAALFALSVPAAAQDVVPVYTAVFPPVVAEDGPRPGYASEIMAEISTISGVDLDVRRVPWARAQRLVRTEPNALIFPLTRTPTREADYHWGFVLFRTSSRFVSVGRGPYDSDQARDLAIGVQSASSWDNWLMENGYQNIYRISNDGDALLRLLVAGRIDVWFTETSIGQSTVAESGFADVRFGPEAHSFNTYLAANRQSPNPKLAALEDAFNALFASSRYNAILEKYGLDPALIAPRKAATPDASVSVARGFGADFR